MAAPTFNFVPAVKTGSKARIALTGGPGEGKTYTALTLGVVLGDNPGVIDTDRRRARKYAHRFGFQHVELDTFDPEDLTRATLAAAEQGIDPLVVDTMSPFWSGQHGMRDRVDEEKSAFEGWKKMRPVERQMLDALLGYPGHVIVNLRSRLKHVVEEDDQGKMKVRRVGLAPEQREGIEYEFDIVGDMVDAVLRITKSMCEDLPKGKTIERPTGELAHTILAWLEREAVGHPLNPLTVRDWALEDGRVPEELGAEYRELQAAGQVTAVVFDRDGETMVGIGDLLRSRATDIKRAQRRAAAQAAAPANGRTLAGAAA